MSDILNEQLSALLDGELPPEETSLLLKRLGREAALAQRLGRYRLCGDVLRGESVQPRADFALRVSAAIAAEPPLPAVGVAPRRPAAVRRLTPLAGLAVAASVAMVAVLVLRQGQGPAPGAVTPAVVADTRPAPSPPLVPVAAPREAPDYGQGSDEPPSYVTPRARPSLGVMSQGVLANYVVAHSQASAPLAGRSVLIHLVADEPRDVAPAR
ncbi:MAG TPA: RseA family anti-sigma factor [Steroidobacteraceae bacterium]|nr:RseA family anti-sigma factor [Steroidobacteraceae bacterium]